MKKLTIVALSFAAAFILSSCGGTKKATKKEGFQEINIPCADKGRSDKNFFRASGSAKSRDMATSRDKALLSSKQRLASLISSTLKSVTEKYVNEMDVADATNFEQTFENMTRDIVKQKLADITITCEKTGTKPDGYYETFIAVEVSKDVILNGVDKGLSNDKKLEVMYDRAKFKEKFDQEMNELKN